MTDTKPDLIERAQEASPPRRRGRWLWYLVAAVAAAAGILAAVLLWPDGDETPVLGADPPYGLAGVELPDTEAEVIAELVDLADPQSVVAVLGVAGTVPAPLGKVLREVGDQTVVSLNERERKVESDRRERILKDHKGKIILVVAHSNTVPVLIANLGASKKVPPIQEDEYDNIYIISIPWFGKTKTIRLRFGDPYIPPNPAA